MKKYLSFISILSTVLLIQACGTEKTEDPKPNSPIDLIEPAQPEENLPDNDSPETPETTPPAQGDSDEDVPKESESKETPLSDTQIREGLGQLPDVSVTHFDESKTALETGRLSMLTANNRHEVYDAGPLRIATFEISNPSTENMNLRVTNLSLTGFVKQRLNKWHMKWQTDTFNFKHYSHWMDRDVQVSNSLSLTLYYKDEQIQPKASFELPAGEIIQAYLTIDFNDVLRCDLPKRTHEKDAPWEAMTQWDLIRLNTEFEASFSIQKSLASQPKAFYKSATHWLDSYEALPKRYTISSKFEFPSANRWHHHNYDSLMGISEEHFIDEFSCNGLY